MIGFILFASLGLSQGDRDEEQTGKGEFGHHLERNRWLGANSLLLRREQRATKVITEGESYNISNSFPNSSISPLSFSGEEGPSQISAHSNDLIETGNDYLIRRSGAARSTNIAARLDCRRFIPRSSRIRSRPVVVHISR